MGIQRRIQEVSQGFQSAVMLPTKLSTEFVDIRGLQRRHQDDTTVVNKWHYLHGKAGYHLSQDAQSWWPIVKGPQKDMHTSSGDTSETPAGEGLHFDNHKARSSKNGLSVLTRTIKTLSSSPGVYRMVGVNGEVLYVGKAKNLKKRVSSYLRLERIPMRLQRMVFNTHSCEIITTHTEAEALLLESNLIKQLKPRYNILLRDDKSFPYQSQIHLSRCRLSTLSRTQSSPYQ